MQGWNQSIRNKENNTKNQQNQELVLWENQHDRQMLSQTKRHTASIQINRIRDEKEDMKLRKFTKLSDLTTNAYTQKKTGKHWQNG